MKTMEQRAPQGLRQKNEISVSMPAGLLGFEAFKRYCLIRVPEEEPLMWFEMADRVNHGFLVVSVEEILPNYRPLVSQQDLDFLGIGKPADMLLLCVVTLRDGVAFANLKGPIVINRRTMVGKQCVPGNVLDLSVEHPVPVLAAAA